jgi:hypothetical protein
MPAEQVQGTVEGGKYVSRSNSAVVPAAERTPLWLTFLDVIFIIGGETLCILGPIRYERIIHITCHTILYAGIGFVGLGAALHWRRQ